MALHHGVVSPVPPAEDFEDESFFPIDTCRPDGVTTFRALHADIATGVHRRVVALTMSLYPDQIRAKDTMLMIGYHSIGRV
jgi:hypothetical protein